MIKVFDNFISSHQISLLKEDMQHRIDTKEYDDKKMYDQKTSMEFRININDHYTRSIIQELIKNVWDIPQNILNRTYIAYQRQFFPHIVHIDDINDTHDQNFLYSGIIPLDENPNNIFKTIIWDIKFKTTKELDNYFRNYDKSSKVTIKKNSDEYDLEHTLIGHWNPLDYINLYGTYTYQLGTLGIFPRINAHCSSNWPKYNLVKNKDFITLHFG